MNIASVAHERKVADATALGLLGLILKSCSVRPGDSIADAANSLARLCDADALFSDWVEELPTQSWDSKSRLQSQLDEWLPEVCVKQLKHLPCDNQLKDLLLEASHLAVRLRASNDAKKIGQEAEDRERIYQFAYGLSHELNNPLANISTRAGVLLQNSREPADRVLLQSIIDSAMRGSEMLGDLMLLARPPELRLEEISPLVLLSQFLSDALPWTSNHGVKLIGDFQCASTIKLSTEHFREVLWALVRNAIEASKPGDQIELQAFDTDGSLSVAVCDEGAGLSKHALKHAFDPYFSGREAGRGLGMGLAKADRLIRLHSGRLSLENRPEGGVLAKIEIPRGV